ncbi:MAG: hypothetical protein E5Y74_00115 [Mesorhizobium sp.]|nr:MAG: hypothetical protein E5Y74_00115 [Mesorhizobium sp.]
MKIKWSKFFFVIVLIVMGAWLAGSVVLAFYEFWAGVAYAVVPTIFFIALLAANDPDYKAHTLSYFEDGKANGR